MLAKTQVLFQFSFITNATSEADDSYALRKGQFHEICK